MLLDKLSLDEEWFLLIMGLLLWIEMLDKNVLLLWWCVFLFVFLLCLRLSGGLVFVFDICILFVFEFGVRNKVFIFGGLFGGLFLFGR